MLYTDGVTDALAPERLLDEEDLLAALSGMSGMGAGEVAQRLESLALEWAPDRAPRDDIALLVAKLG